MRLWKRVQNYFVPTHENVYRPHLLGRASLVFFLALTLAVEGFLVSNLVARQSDGTFLSAVFASDVIWYTNTERAQAKVSEVHEDKKLDAAAQAKADDMAAKGYFSHVGPDGALPWTWVLRSGYAYKVAGENLAVRFTDSSDVVHAWMASPSHRANVLKPVYADIGVGVANGMFEGQPATFVVQYFGTVENAPPINLPKSVVQNGAVVSIAPEAGSFLQNMHRQLIRVLNDPAQTANWILGTIAVLLFAVVIVTFFMHIEVQSQEVLFGGAIVAAVALLCVAANTRILPLNSQQPAGVIQAFDQNDATFSMDAAE